MARLPRYFVVIAVMVWGMLLVSCLPQPDEIYGSFQSILNTKDRIKYNSKDYFQPFLVVQICSMIVHNFFQVEWLVKRQAELQGLMVGSDRDGIYMLNSEGQGLCLWWIWKHFQRLKHQWFAPIQISYEGHVFSTGRNTQEMPSIHLRSSSGTWMQSRIYSFMGGWVWKFGFRGDLQYTTSQLVHGLPTRILPTWGGKGSLQLAIYIPQTDNRIWMKAWNANWFYFSA